MCHVPKDNVVTTSPKKRCLNEGYNYGDYLFECVSPAGRKASDNLQFRVVQCHERDIERWLDFLTNDKDLKPEQIRGRWFILGVL